MENQFRVHLLVLIGILLSISLTACGGESNPQSSLPPQIAPELLIDSHVIPHVNAITSDQNYLYLATQFELIRYDKVTGIREVLAGNLVDPFANFERDVISSPHIMIKDGLYLYTVNAVGPRIQKTFLGEDGKTSVEIIVPQAGLVNLSIGSLAGNDEKVFWTSGATLFGKEYTSDEPAEIITTFSNQIIGLRATSSALFVTAQSGNTNSLYKYELSSENLELIQDNISLNAWSEIPTALSETKFYWANGDVIFAMMQSSNSAEILVNRLSNIRHMTANESELYALQGGLGESNTIYKIDLNTKVNTPVVTLDDIRDIIVHDGKLYWISALGLYTLNEDGTTSERYVNDGTEIIMGGAGGTEMVAVSGKIVVSAGKSQTKILFYDIGKGTTSIIRPLGTSFKIYASTHSVYYGDINHGIGRIPIDLNFRYPETLLDNLASVEKLFLVNGLLYWSEFSNFAGVYRISRMRTDGSQFEILFDGIHRGLAVYQERLYFMCKEACAFTNWMLVSMPLNGGKIEQEYPLKMGPAQMVEKDGVFYIADTENGGTMNIYAINLGSNESVEIVSELPYLDIIIDISSNWFYTLQNGKLVRYKFNAWNSLGVGQPIDMNNEPLIFVNSIYSHGNSLYYWLWKNGLKKLSE